MIIRKYVDSDRKAVEKIHFDTGFLGKSMDVFLSQHRFWTAGIRYYLEKEPQSIFVADDEGTIAGYILGCLDDSKHSEFLSAIMTTTSNLLHLPMMPKKDRKFWVSQIKVCANNIMGKSGEIHFETPSDSGHLHINMVRRYRGKGIGTRLLNTFFKYAQEKGVKRVHADSFKTRLNPNQTFWMKNGFKEYSEVKTSFWSDIYPEEEIFLVCYVRDIE